MPSTSAALLLFLLPTTAASPLLVHAAGGSTAMDDLVGAKLRTQTFLHIPGPNPILTVGSNTSWDGLELECAGGVLQEYDTYYMIYHATTVHDTRPGTKPGTPGYYQVPLSRWYELSLTYVVSNFASFDARTALVTMGVAT